MPKQQQKQVRSAHAFTLIELLIAIAVIGILLALLLPALANSRRTARHIMSLNHLRSMQQATNMSLVDRNGAYPQPGEDSDLPEQEMSALNWFNLLDSYLENSNQQDRLGRTSEPFKQSYVWQTFDKDTQAVSRTFKMNAHFGNLDNRNGTTPVLTTYEKDINHPSQTVLYGDGRAQDTPSTTTQNIDKQTAAHFHLRESTIGLRHHNNQAAMLSFCDGHVKLISDIDVSQSGAGYNTWTPEACEQAGLIWNPHL